MKRISRIIYAKDIHGYAILFAVTIVSIISVIALGLTNAAYKELILSSVARDSDAAFYQADTASECALYADNQTQIPADPSVITWSCGLDASGVNQMFNIVTPTSRDQGYNIVPQNATSQNPCFTITVTKTATTPVVTTITSKGYNICNISNIRTVERQINVSY